MSSEPVFNLNPKVNRMQETHDASSWTKKKLKVKTKEFYFWESDRRRQVKSGTHASILLGGQIEILSAARREQAAVEVAAEVGMVCVKQTAVRQVLRVMQGFYGRLQGKKLRRA